MNNLIEPNTTHCYDCELEYDSPGWIEAVVPTAFWLAISPTGHDGGILCINCMSRRFAERGFRHVPVRLETGAFRVCVHNLDYYSLWHILTWRIMTPLFMKKRIRKKNLLPLTSKTLSCVR